ncbi:protein FAM200C-like [Palaemon carinicauda]|uniref:protein FAM200C-like n=1 Tax=Palaemon carinicauda TaxID=392227 RepID=UPI0035B6887A
MKSGFVSIVKEKAPHVLTTHCVLHRQALASKTLPKILKEGRDVDIIQAKGKVVAFTRKQPIWCRRVESGNLANFLNLDNILTKDGKTLPVEILQEVKNHLEILSTNFEGYFSDTNDLCMESVWIQNPFSFDVSRLSDNDIAKDDFTEFQEDPRKKADFKRAGMDVKQFWCEQISAYPSLAIRAMNVLVPYTTTYLCEIGFSVLLYLKSKWRNRPDVSDDMRVALSATVPRFDALIAGKQQQISH